MSVIQNHPLLHRSVEDLPVSESFRMDFLKAGLETISEALAFNGDTLIAEKQFSYHTITELIKLLDQEGLAKLFKD